MGGLVFNAPEIVNISFVQLGKYSLSNICLVLLIHTLSPDLSFGFMSEAAVPYILLCKVLSLDLVTDEGGFPIVRW